MKKELIFTLSVLLLLAIPVSAIIEDDSSEGEEAVADIFQEGVISQEDIISLGDFESSSFERRIFGEEHVLTEERNIGDLFGRFLDPSAELNYSGYIVQFEEPSVIERKVELEDRARRNEEFIFNKVPGVNVVYRAVVTMPDDVPSRVERYSQDLDSLNERVKGRIANTLGEESFVRITGSAVEGNGNSEEIELLGEFKTVFNGVALDISDEEAKEVEDVRGVKKVSRNMQVEILLDDSVPLIQDGIPAGQLDRNGNDCGETGEECLTGEGIKIAIIDTGVDYTHPDLGGCTTEEFLDGECEKVAGGYDFSDNDSDPIDYMGHGTHVAATAAGDGVLKGVAPEAEILAYKVFPNAYADVIIKSIEKAVEDDADVLSLSLGVDCKRHYGGYKGYCGPDDSVSQAVDNAVSDGKVVVVAAGNSGPGEQSIGSPGTARKAITVGAVDKQDELASFSSIGPVIWEDGEGNERAIVKPDVSAPGVDICAAGDFFIDRGTDISSQLRCLDDSHIAISGTSMATPHVSGAVALLLQKNPEWTPEEIKDSFMATSSDLDLSPIEQGEGRMNISEAIVLEEPKEPEPLPYVYIISPKPEDIFSLESDKIQIEGVIFGEYSRIEVDYRKENEEVWKSEGIDIIDEDNLIAEFDISKLENQKGMYEFRASVYNENGTLSSLVNIFFFEEVAAEISSCSELQKMNSPDYSYAFVNFHLTNNIDCSETMNWNCDDEGVCSGFEPVNSFNFNRMTSLNLDGREYEIRNLYINRNESRLGLFRLILEYSKIENISLIGNRITGEDLVGGIVGESRGNITNSYSTGDVTGEGWFVGGLAGNNGGTIENSYSTGDVTGEGWFVGGLVGENFGWGSRPNITNSYSTGDVTGETLIGGLVGFSSGNIKNSYSIGSVTGETSVGGLSGSSRGNIKNSYSMGSAIGNNYVGGLSGFNLGIIENSYSTGDVTGEDFVGGLIGTQTIYGRGNTFNSFWDIRVSGLRLSEGGEGKNTVEMRTKETFVISGWDFNNVWGINDRINDGYPYLTDNPPSQKISSFSKIKNSEGENVTVNVLMKIEKEEGINSGIWEDYVEVIDRDYEIPSEGELDLVELFDEESVTVEDKGNYRLIVTILDDVNGEVLVSETVDFHVGPPVVEMTSNPKNIEQAQDVVLSWKSSNARACNLRSTEGWAGARSSSGSEKVSPSSEETEYTFTCVNDFGSSSDIVTFGPPFVEITSNSKNIARDQNATLSWKSSNANTCSLESTEGWKESRPKSGSEKVSPPETTTYLFECSNDIGSSNDSVTIGVEILPTVEVELIPESIEKGQYTTISWESTNADSCRVKVLPEEEWFTIPLSGSEKIYPPETMTFLFECSNDFGSSDEEVTLEVLG